MGYQPGLDGIRAISVIAVMLYHAGFTWMHGGFFGVEVFFVVSGFLITSLLLDERESTGRMVLTQFWLRRARRLLPALFTMLLAVSLWGALFGSAQQVSQLKRDLPWAIFYVGNWGQILGKVPYFAGGEPSLLRHLWSLAVEEQWYLIWPLVFVALAATAWTAIRKAAVLAGVAALSMVVMFWLHAGGPGPLGGPPGLFADTDRTNFMYLSTITRCSGLLLGAAAAFGWRPWRARGRHAHHLGRALDYSGAVAIGLLLCVFGVASLTDGYVYQWLLPLVSILSLVAVLVVVHPAATGMRAVMSARPLVELGRRSYGLYLWSWPISVVVGARSGSVWKFTAAMVITAVLSEACYRYVEVPVRAGALRRWWRARPSAAMSGLVGSLAVVVALSVYYAGVEQFDPARDTSTAEAAVVPVAPVVPAAEAAPAVVAASAPSVTAAALPRKVVIVGDSQAHSLALNLPDGIEDQFTFTDGSVEGCGVYDAGTVISTRDGFHRSFADCGGWADSWGAAAAEADADVAAVVIGAWEVFDIGLDGRVVAFGSPDGDELFRAGLQRGIDALTAAGAKVALIEIPCMRPQDVEGAGVPALPERGDDARVAHLNELLRGIAAADPANVSFVAGPAAWCNDESIASDLGYRWDGVHVYKPGAALIYETIAPALLSIPI
jgi:peptidoglycan/LPS O-acetylase OafA/YrhL